ncbi:hypothetical protein SAMN06265222_1079 [Neorhodopirellula lusitana]|uniref:Uncharacterized protein n=1 Tax=Neorhodopirellula lusitana TaxID=445327 RepID=A0ABY1Q674_9BACT|nr:hypothetical protein [Neorhodopirellula lusitana]SMP60870.1 hypothetical protein SAMN06265222_1079 [Neorhodopirellula lusitana]
MEALLGLLAMTVLAVSVIGWLWITVKAFSEGEVLWGIGCLIISPLCLVYGFLNFHELKIPFLMVLGGFFGRLVIGLIATSLG